jgi:hypothetical protein
MDTNTVTFDEWYDNEPGLKYHGGDYKGIANAAWNAARATALTGEERLAIDWAATVAKEQAQVGIHKTLRRLLEQKN